ncbi:MAG: sulfotransferase domain-containing protein [Anaerolineales bacterium]|nr:sulfotransferase domain-containing protein [Anaerolineales bacterium]
MAQFLEGISSVSPLVFTAEHPVQTITREGRLRSDERVMKDLARLEPGDVGWGYIPAREPFFEMLTGSNWVTYFIYRDPRDKIISHIYFAMDIHTEHAMRDYYRSLPSMEARISATIEGVPGLIGSIVEGYASHRGWLSSPDVVKIRFEELIQHREANLETMLAPLYGWVLSAHIRYRDLVGHLAEEMSPEHSRTYRSGRAGTWREHFTLRNIDQFKRVAGDLLIEMGYEQDDSWS